MGVPEGRKKALRWIALLATALVLAVAAPLALAAIQIQNPKAQPLDTKQAGAPTRFETKITLGGTEHIKDLTTETPRGFGANIQNPTCTTADFNADTCPADTQIASTSVNLSLEPTPGVFVPTDPVSGRVYFLDLAYPDVKLDIEVDGFDFHRTRTVFDADRVRQNDLVRVDWTVLRFTSRSAPEEIVSAVRPFLFVR